MNFPANGPGDVLNRSIGGLFEDVVAVHGGKVAVSDGSASLTYAQLNTRADDLAAALRQIGVGHESMVGCCCHRSLDLIVALLAIIKAGACYVPLDPAYPAERLKFMLADTNCSAIVTTSDLTAALPAGHGVPIVKLDARIWPAKSAKLAAIAGPRSLAYVMYTSGSTGHPKGVLVEQRSIVRLVRDTRYCRLGADETWLHYAPLAFDASTLEIWGPLLNGGRLIVAPPRASLEDLGRIIREQSVTSVWLTSGLFTLMVEHRLADLTGLRQLLAGGDVLSPRHVKLALAALPGCTIINGYGPTENTTFTCCYAMPPGSTPPEPLPIGQPIANTTVYLLDEDMQPVAAGARGELYTGGAGVARGYLNNQAATQQQFLPDPFSRDPTARMYRTGDVARMRSDGAFEFLGRVDDQIKLLGHRIEPAEIEAVMLTHPDVAQASVAVHTDEQGGKRLISYYVAKASDPGPVNLRDFLNGVLPRYMIPALIVPLPSMPLNVNGKIDKAALPKPAITGPAADPSAADLGVEAIVRGAWQLATQRDTIDVNDNFFDIGGDSLKLVSLHAGLERALNREIPIVDLFEFSSFGDLVRRLQGQVRKGFSDADQDRANRQRAAFSKLRAARAGAGKL